MANASPSFTSFDGHQRIAAGNLQTNALAVKHVLERGAHGPVLTFDDQTGQVVEIDVRGTDDELVSRLSRAAPQGVESEPEQPLSASRGRGRPKLGVVAREVTLLPRHWDWLASQPGGASVSLRKLVEEARKAGTAQDRQRQAQERAYNVIVALAGNLAGFEEATRALFADDAQRFARYTDGWPPDVRAHARRLAFADRLA